MNWLIVEDHPMFKDKVIQDLSSSYPDVSILAASNGLGALEILQKKKIELNDYFFLNMTFFTTKRTHINYQLFTFQ